MLPVHGFDSFGEIRTRGKRIAVSINRAAFLIEFDLNRIIAGKSELAGYPQLHLLYNFKLRFVKERGTRVIADGSWITVGMTGTNADSRRKTSLWLSDFLKNLLAEHEVLKIIKRRIYTITQHIEIKKIAMSGIKFLASSAACR